MADSQASCSLSALNALSITDLRMRACDEVALEGPGGCLLSSLWERLPSMPPAVRRFVWHGIQADALLQLVDPPSDLDVSNAAHIRLVASPTVQMRSLGVQPQHLALLGSSEHLLPVLRQVGAARNIGVGATMLCGADGRVLPPARANYVIKLLTDAGLVEKRIRLLRRDGLASATPPPSTSPSAPFTASTAANGRAARSQPPQVRLNWVHLCRFAPVDCRRSPPEVSQSHPASAKGKVDSGGHSGGPAMGSGTGGAVPASWPPMTPLTAGLSLQERGHDQAGALARVAAGQSMAPGVEEAVTTALKRVARVVPGVVAAVRATQTTQEIVDTDKRSIVLLVRAFLDVWAEQRLRQECARHSGDASDAASGTASGQNVSGGAQRRILVLRDVLSAFGIPIRRADSLLSFIRSWSSRRHDRNTACPVDVSMRAVGKKLTVWCVYVPDKTSPDCGMFDTQPCGAVVELALETQIARHIRLAGSRGISAAELCSAMGVRKQLVVRSMLDLMISRSARSLRKQADTVGRQRIYRYFWIPSHRAGGNSERATRSDGSAPVEHQTVPQTRRDLLLALVNVATVGGQTAQGSASVSESGSSLHDALHGQPVLPCRAAYTYIRRIEAKGGARFRFDFKAFERMCLAMESEGLFRLSEITVALDAKVSKAKNNPLPAASQTLRLILPLRDVGDAPERFGAAYRQAEQNTRPDLALPSFPEPNEMPASVQQATAALEAAVRIAASQTASGSAHRPIDVDAAATDNAESSIESEAVVERIVVRARGASKLKKEPSRKKVVENDRGVRRTKRNIVRQNYADSSDDDVSGTDIVLQARKSRRYTQTVEHAVTKFNFMAKTMNHAKAVHLLLWRYMLDESCTTTEPVNVTNALASLPLSLLLMLVRAPPDITDHDIAELHKELGLSKSFRIPGAASDATKDKGCCPYCGAIMTQKSIFIHRGRYCSARNNLFPNSPADVQDQFRFPHCQLVPTVQQLLDGVGATTANSINASSLLQNCARHIISSAADQVHASLLILQQLGLGTVSGLPGGQLTFRLQKRVAIMMLPSSHTHTFSTLSSLSHYWSDLEMFCIDSREHSQELAGGTLAALPWPALDGLDIENYAELKCVEPNSFLLARESWVGGGRRPKPKSRAGSASVSSGSASVSRAANAAKQKRKSNTPASSSKRKRAPRSVDKRKATLLQIIEQNRARREGRLHAVCAQRPCGNLYISGYRGYGDEAQQRSKRFKRPELDRGNSPTACTSFVAQAIATEDDITVPEVVQCEVTRDMHGSCSDQHRETLLNALDNTVGDSSLTKPPSVGLLELPFLQGSWRSAGDYFAGASVAQTKTASASKCNALSLVLSSIDDVAERSCAHRVGAISQIFAMCAAGEVRLDFATSTLATAEQHKRRRAQRKEKMGRQRGSPPPAGAMPPPPPPLPSLVPPIAPPALSDTRNDVRLAFDEARVIASHASHASNTSGDLGIQHAVAREDAAATCAAVHIAADEPMKYYEDDVLDNVLRERITLLLTCRPGLDAVRNTL